MLIDEIKARMFKAMKAGSKVETEILRVAVGEITTDAARPGKKGDDEEALAIIRKIVKSNEETVSALGEDSRKAVLQEENRILQELLPQSLTEDQILEALAGVSEQLKAAGNDGQATGIAMKQLKAAGSVVNGKDVSAAVRRIRSSS